MPQIMFRVTGHLPPKKDGANSMWKKPAEVSRLLALRRAALAALRDGPPFQDNIRLVMRVYVGRSNDRGTGDLDNFVTGVCDGLMAAAPRMPWRAHPAWLEAENDAIRPDRVVAIVDDSQIIEIRACKLQGREAVPWYEIELSDDAVVT